VTRRNNPLDFAVLPLWVEKWVENCRCLEPVKPGAAQCRFVSLVQRVYRLADGHQPLIGFGGPVGHHGKVLLAAGSKCDGLHVAARAASRPVT
jgi:hypothetical protein